MSTREPGALWEEALEGPDTDLLADEIAELAVRWAEGDPGALRHAAAILARTPYLGDNES